MSKEERFIYHCDNYDYADIIYDTKEYQECDSMQMATNWLNRQDQQLALTEKALELACEELGKVEVFDKEFMECDSFYDYFKTKAKEMMKSE